MSERVTRKLNFSRKLLLAAASIVIVATPIVAGVLHAPRKPAASQAQNAITTSSPYESVSITPNKSGSEMVKLMFGPDEFISKNGDDVVIAFWACDAAGFRGAWRDRKSTRL